MNLLNSNITDELFFNWNIIIVSSYQDPETPSPKKQGMGELQEKEFTSCC